VRIFQREGCGKPHQDAFVKRAEKKSSFHPGNQTARRLAVLAGGRAEAAESLKTLKLQEETPFAPPFFGFKGIHHWADGLQLGPGWPGVSNQHTIWEPAPELLGVGRDSRGITSEIIVRRAAD
jgi:hypothetical protein